MSTDVHLLVRYEPNSTARKFYLISDDSYLWKVKNMWLMISQSQETVLGDFVNSTAFY